MKEEQIKEMLNGIINNGERWEYRWYTADGWSNWKDYKLGDEIYNGYEYRKVEIWYVYKVENEYRLYSVKSDLNDNILFSGTKEECENFIRGYTKKTWLADYLESNYGENAQYYIKIGTTEVCKKILEEMENRALSGVSATTLRNIFKDLGIEL